MVVLIIFDQSSLFFVASQNWNIGRYLPLLIGDLVPHDDNYWQCFLYLHKILSIILCVSPCISAATISYLTELIAAHHELCKERYPTVCITPKLHYMIHIPEHIKRLST